MIKIIGTDYSDDQASNRCKIIFTPLTEPLYDFDIHSGEHADEKVPCMGYIYPNTSLENTTQFTLKLFPLYKRCIVMIFTVQVCNN